MYEKLTKCLDFFVIEALKINKISEFYSIFAGKNFPLIFGGVPGIPLAPVSYAHAYPRAVSLLPLYS